MVWSWKRLALLAAPVLAAVLALVFVSAPAAVAGSDGPVLCNPTGRACGWFTQSGDVVHVEDTDCDGHAAVVQVSIASVNIHENLWNTDGCGTTDTKQYGTSVPEGSTVYYRPCSGVWSTQTLYDCNSGWTHGTA